jgi:hypothetical protein
MKGKAQSMNVLVNRIYEVCTISAGSGPVVPSRSAPVAC